MGMSDALTTLRVSVNQTFSRPGDAGSVVPRGRAPLQLDCEVIASNAEVCTVPSGPGIANALDIPSLAASPRSRAATARPAHERATPAGAAPAAVEPAAAADGTPIVAVQNRPQFSSEVGAAIAGSTSELALASGNADGVIITPPDRPGAIAALTAATRRDTEAYTEVNRVRELFNRRFGTNYTTEQFNYILGAARYSLEAGGHALPDGRRVYAKLTRAAWMAVAAHAIQLANADGTLRFGNQPVNVAEATQFVETVLASNVAEDLRRLGKAGTQSEVADAVEQAGQRFMSTPMPGERRAALRFRMLPGQSEDAIVFSGRRRVDHIYAATPELRRIAVAGTVAPSAAPLIEGLQSTGVIVASDALSPTQRRALQLEAQRQDAFDRAIGREAHNLDRHRAYVARLVERRIEVREAEQAADARDPSAPRVVRV